MSAPDYGMAAAIEAYLGPAFAADFRRELAGPDDGLPWLGDDENVHPADRTPPTTVGIFDAIPMPRDPFHSLGDDAE